MLRSLTRNVLRARYVSRAVLVSLNLAAAGCSAKPPTPQPPPKAPEAAPPVGPPQLLVPPPDPREALLSSAIVQLLENDHLLRKTLDDDVSRTAFATYMDRLDSSKMFLLREDREALGQYKDKIDDELHSGALDLAHEGTRRFVAQVGVVEKLVAELLAAPMNHDDAEFIELDPKKVEVAADVKELRERWRRRLELEVLERVAQMETRLAAAEKAKAAAAKPGDKSKPVDAGAPDDGDDDASSLTVAQIPTTPEAREAKARTDLAKAYAARFTRLRHPGPFDSASELVNAVAASFDPHTDYLPPADKANFDIRLSGSLEGIGAMLREHDDYVEVIELVPGGASWRQGKLTPGDLILSVAADGKEPVDTADMRIDDVVKMIRGPKGTVVHLRVQKKTGIQETISITRDVVKVEESYARGAIVTHKGQKSVGYIHLPSFYGGRGAGQRTSAGDVRHLLTEMKAKKVSGVVLDIRSNGGGLLVDAIEMSGAMIDKGPIVQVQDNGGHREVLSDKESGTDFDGPVVVLVDRFSASASEILAGALQDYHRAVIVGTGPTHGKGTVQTIADLDRVVASRQDLGSLKITIQQFFRVSGSSTQREGVTPDILLPDPDGHIETGERTLEHAIPWSKVTPAEHEDWKPKWKVSTLAERSTARVSKQPSLAKIAAMTQILKARHDDTKLPLAKAAWETRRNKQREELAAASPDLKAGPPLLDIASLGEEPAPTIEGKPDDRLARWREGISRDPWIDECVQILGDMAK